MRDTWLNARLGDDLATLPAGDPADAVVIDCMLAGVLARSGEFAAPGTVLVHGLYQSVLPIRDAMLAAGSRMLPGAGLPVPDPDAMKWESEDLVLVATLPELDGVAGSLAGNVRYLRPVFAWRALEGWQRARGRRAPGSGILR